MSVYVLQARSGKEQEACRRLRRMGYDAFIPMKTMQLRSGGTWFEKTLPIFTQYIFIRFEPSPEDYHLIRSVEGVVRFLGNSKPEPISTAEEAYMMWLWNEGKPLGVSKVFISAQGEKMILSGPLRKYQGSEIEYRLRQRRAAVYITLCGKKRKLILPVVAV